MNQGKSKQINQDKSKSGQPVQESNKSWEEPKVDFVEPKLTNHGEIKSITGFFGPFSPG